VFADLLREPGVTETARLGSTFGFMAFHGGSLEVGTDVIAAAAAERSGASLYTVAQPEDLNWHIPSKLVGPDASPALAAFLDHVEVVVAVHGFGRDGLFTSLLLGGQDRALAAWLGDHLRPALPHYDVVADLDRIPVALRGMHADNPVNLPRHGGVQLELPPRVRGLGPYWEDPARSADRHTHTEALVDALAGAARAWPEGRGR
jgi:phage replication-related protein YjqB (UPF0714/DUF867 family)